MTGPRPSIWLARMLGVGTWDTEMIPASDPGDFRWVPIELTPPSFFYGYCGMRGWIGRAVVRFVEKLGVEIWTGRGTKDEHGD